MAYHDQRKGNQIVSICQACCACVQVRLPAIRERTLAPTGIGWHWDWALPEASHNSSRSCLPCPLPLWLLGQCQHPEPGCHHLQDKLAHAVDLHRWLGGFIGLSGRTSVLPSCVTWGELHNVFVLLPFIIIDSYYYYVCDHACVCWHTYEQYEHMEVRRPLCVVRSFLSILLGSGDGTFSLACASYAFTC